MTCPSPETTTWKPNRPTELHKTKCHCGSSRSELVSVGRDDLDTLIAECERAQAAETYWLQRVIEMESVTQAQREMEDAIKLVAPENDPPEFEDHYSEGSCTCSATDRPPCGWCESGGGIEP